MLANSIVGRSEIINEGNEIKGNSVRARRRYLLEQYGPAMHDAVAAGLAEVPLQYLTGQILAASSYDMRPLIDLDVAIIEKAMGGDIRGMRKLGTIVSRYELSTIYKMFFALGTPGFILNRITSAFRQYAKRGTMSVLEAKERCFLIELNGGGIPLYMCKEVFIGWFVAAVELSGGKNAIVEHVTCRHLGAPTCRWEIRWQ